MSNQEKPDVFNMTEDEIRAELDEIAALPSSTMRMRDAMRAAALHNALKLIATVRVPLPAPPPGN